MNLPLQPTFKLLSIESLCSSLHHQFQTKQNMSKIAVFGASAPTGKLVVQQALESRANLAQFMLRQLNST
jgi:hypothetical protein